MGLRVIVFHVERGFCAFIKTPTRRTLLIDCGCSDDFSPALYIAEHELPNALNHSNRKLTSLTITHPDQDHVADIETVVRECPPAIIYRQHYDWPEVTPRGDGDALRSYSQWQQTYRQPAQVPDLGMEIKRFGLTPAEARKLDYAKFVNNSSMVVVATFKGTEVEEKFLFGGDIEESGWQALLEEPSFRSAIQNVDFFVVSRHGHPAGFSAALFDAMGAPPILNIVSSHAKGGHIDERYSQEQYARGKRLPGGEKQRMLSTAAEGSILIGVDETGKYKLATEHLAPNRTSGKERSAH